MASSRSASGGTVLASGIRTRERKERKLYSDDWALGDEEIEGHHTFNLEEKIKTDKFDLNFVKDMTDSEFNLTYMQKNGFNWPLLFKNKNHLGIVVPSSEFTINDVRLCVGSRRMLDVMDVNTQKNVEMTMKDWQRYYESQDKDKLLNVISLEFSHTKLETLVEAPTVVRQIDWVEKVWPRHLKEAQTESTNVLEDMMYPKVQKYCLMSVSGCYTDFHIDFGGTSVWYHILKGKKIFWLIPPSERNLQLYEQWVLSGKQSDIFFGDTVEKCARVELQAGNTFFIPTGWIHAVYTPEDSLVFGGNFLHSFGIEKQLRVAHVEDTTHVPQKFRYPFFTEMLWYLLERYVHVLLGRTHLTLPPEEQEKYERAKDKMNNNKKTEHVHLTQYELHGMKAIVMYLHSLPTSKKFVPELIKDPIALIRDVRTVVEEHRYDSPELAATNQPVLEWWEREPVRYTVKRSVCDPTIYIKKRRQSGDEPRSSVVKLPPNVAKIRHRRIRCKECEPCTRGDCQQCVFCKDMVKYGGSGTMKQTCKLKKCVQPVLPASASCYLCHLDGWMRPIGNIVSKPPNTGPSNLMECIICFKISHLSCLETKFKGIESTVNEDLPNSWECAECIQLGYNKEYKHNRTPSSRISSGGSDSAKSPLVLSENDDNKAQVKVELKSSEDKLLEEDVKPTVNGTTGVRPENSSTSDHPNLRMPTWEQLQDRVSYSLVRPSWVIRPAPPFPFPDQTEEKDEGSGSNDERESEDIESKSSPVTMKKEIMLKVFSKLPRIDLLTVMRVCTQWSKWAVDPSLWRRLSVPNGRITSLHLHGIVRRQPLELVLDWSEISYDQFSWLICRLPQVQRLHCEGLSWEIICPLVSPYCPPLLELNISFCEGIDDETLTALLRPPHFNRPGFRDSTSRLRQLEHFRLAGTQIGDASVSLIARSLPSLTHIDLSGCLRINNSSIEYLSHSSSLVCHSLKGLDLRGCHQLNPLILPHIAELPILSYLALDPCDHIPLKAIKVWGTTHGYSFDKGNVMRRVSRVKQSSALDSISDAESDTGQCSKSSLCKEEIPKTIDNKEETKTDSGSSVKEECPKTESKEASAKPKSSTEKNNKETSDGKDSKEVSNKEGKLLRDKNVQNSKDTVKKEAPQLKCVLTPLEKRCDSTTKVAYIELKGESSSNKEKSGYKSEKPSPTDEDAGYSPEDKPSLSCRRSERRNKGTKYKINFVKKKVSKEKLKTKCSFMKGDKKSKTQSETLKNLEKCSSVKSQKRSMNKTMKREIKRNKRKNIITRSKKLKGDGADIHSKPEYEVVQRPFLKGPKDGHKLTKDGQGQCSKISENEDSLKVRIALKSGSHYSSKLRKKAKEDESPSPSSSPDAKRNNSETREEVKSERKNQEESSSTGKKLKNQKESSLSSASSSFIKKRKDRMGSSSSSSSSSSPSSSPCLPLSKKLKVELKPISKIGRRRSDVLKPVGSVVNLGNAGKGESSGATQANSSGTVAEKTSGRERPERHHRSPRRLSMCQ